MSAVSTGSGEWSACFETEVRPSGGLRGKGVFIRGTYRGGQVVLMMEKPIRISCEKWVASLLPPRTDECASRVHIQGKRYPSDMGVHAAGAVWVDQNLLSSWPTRIPLW